MYSKQKKSVESVSRSMCICLRYNCIHEYSSFILFQLVFGIKALLPIEINIEDVDPDDIKDLDDDAETIEVLTDQRIQNLATAKEKAQEKQKQV